MNKRKGKKTKSILVVDDEPSTVEILEFALTEMGYNTVGANSGFEALDKYDTAKPDLLLIDFMMPEMAGLELLKRIREKDSSTPIVMLSAHSEPDLVMKAFEIGLDDFLLKPFRIEELQSSIDAALKFPVLKRWLIARLGGQHICVRDRGM